MKGLFESVRGYRTRAGVQIQILERCGLLCSGLAAVARPGWRERLWVNYSVSKGSIKIVLQASLLLVIDRKS